MESEDGVHWGTPKILLGPTKTGWEDDINRPSVIKRDGVYHMWYTGQFHGHSSIGYATSKDGLTWLRRDRPVLEPDQAWEKVAVMCPTVLWDATAHQFRMWFSGGDQYEPDAIGYAVSTDGIHWKKNIGPVFDCRSGEPVGTEQALGITALPPPMAGLELYVLRWISRH